MMTPGPVDAGTRVSGFVRVGVIVVAGVPVMISVQADPTGLTGASSFWSIIARIFVGPVHGAQGRVPLEERSFRIGPDAVAGHGLQRVALVPADRTMAVGVLVLPPLLEHLPDPAAGSPRRRHLLSGSGSDSGVEGVGAVV